MNELSDTFFALVVVAIRHGDHCCNDEKATNTPMTRALKFLGYDYVSLPLSEVPFSCPAPLWPPASISH